jgi:hypothetical protein
MTIHLYNEMLFSQGIAARFGPALMMAVELLRGKEDVRSTYPLSSRPERTRISCHAAPDMATCAAFGKESRMKIAKPPNSTGNPG